MNTKYVALASAGALLFAGCHSVGGGPSTTKTYGVSGFTGVSASAGVDVELKQGPFAVSASGPENSIEKLNIEVQGSTLKIGRRAQMNFFSINSGHVVVTVTAPTYSELHASSGSDMKADSISVVDLVADVSSGADMKLAGSCKKLSLEISSGADFDGGDLKCEAVEASASSGSDAVVFASAAMRGHASSGADIKVLGRPANLDRDESSGGSVKAP